jgi:hypothetical protein
LRTKIDFDFEKAANVAIRTVSSACSGASTIRISRTALPAAPAPPGPEVAIMSPSPATSATMPRPSTAIVPAATTSVPSSLPSSRRSS